MIVVNRFRVADPDAFGADAREPLALLRTRPGLESADLVRNLDEPDLWALVTRWADVGSYRRAFHGYEGKAVLVPFLSRSIDEPSAYAAPEDVGENVPRVR